jgi:hypothetical protein
VTNKNLNYCAFCLKSQPKPGSHETKTLSTNHRVIKLFHLFPIDQPENLATTKARKSSEYCPWQNIEIVDNLTLIFRDGVVREICGHFCPTVQPTPDTHLQLHAESGS